MPTVVVVVLAVASIALVYIVNNRSGDDEDTPTEATVSPEQEIEQIGNEWAPPFAADHELTAEGYQTQPLSERITCNRHGEPIENCTPLSSELRESFEGATVEDVAIKGRKAAAQFSNGETVEFIDAGGQWLIQTIAADAGDEPAVDHKRCGTYGRWRLAVYGDIPCSLARHVMRGFAHNRLPPFWTCEGPDGHVECAREGSVIVARFSDTSQRSQPPP